MQRSPEKVAQLRSDAQIILNNILVKLCGTYNDKRTPSDPKTFEEWLQLTTENGYFERAKALLLQEAILLPETTRFVAQLHWGVCSMNDNNHRLLTSDRPVIMSNGLAYSYGHIALPIGPRKLFLAARTPEVARDICGRRDFAEATNDLIVRQAHTYVYGARQFSAQLRRKTVA